MRLRAATRGSELARWQTDRVAALIREAHPEAEVEVVAVDTFGDRRRDLPIWELGGKGVFAKEVQAAVLDGRADLAVHSAKDLPSVTPPDLVLAAVPVRADPRDALVGSRLADVPAGATVATGSPRRRAQLADARPDLTFADIRGNVPTRVAKAEGLGAVVVAAAALDRLGLADRAAEVLDPSVLLPQVGQGTLAVECAASRPDVAELLAAVEHGPSRRGLDAERAFLAELGGDCDLPAGAHATLGTDGSLRLDSILASLDGHVILRHRVEGDHGEALGSATARHLLDHAGGAALLEA